MRRVAVLFVGLVLGACGGKIESVSGPIPEHRPADPNHPQNPGSPGYPGPPDPEPNPVDDVQQPSPDQPAPKPADALGAKLPPTEGVACGPGMTVEMSYRISEWNMSHGASSNTGAGHCVGTVQFANDLSQTFIAGHTEGDGTTYGWTSVQSVANGRSVNLSPQNIPSHVHTSTLYYADGRTELQYCTFFAYCENGLAKSVSFTW